MKIFQLVQKNFKTIGISAECNSFGLYEFRHVAVYILVIMLLGVHIVYVSETVTERVKSIVIVAQTLLVLIVYLSYKYNSLTVFKIIGDVEQAIEKSQYLLQSILFPSQF